MARGQLGGMVTSPIDTCINSSCPRAQNVKLLCYSQSKNRLHRNPLYVVTSIVGAGIEKANQYDNHAAELALGCDEIR